MLLQEITHVLDLLRAVRASAGVFGILPNVDFTNWPVRCPSDHLFSTAWHHINSICIVENS